MVSFKVMFFITPKVNYRTQMAGKKFYEWYAGCNCNMIAAALKRITPGREILFAAYTGVNF